MSAATQTLKPTVGGTMRANEELLRDVLGDEIANALAHLDNLDLVDEAVFLKANDTLRLALLRAKKVPADLAPQINTELAHAYDLLGQMGIVASVSVSVNVSSPAQAPAQPVRDADADEDDSTFLRRSTRGRFVAQHTLDFADFAPYLGLELVDMTGTIVSKVREARSGGRGLFGVQDSYIAENLATLATTREGTVEIMRRDGSSINLQILNLATRHEAAGNLIDLARTCGIDDALVAAAAYYRSGAIDGAMRTMGNSNVTSTTEGKVTPRAIRERVRAALVAISQLMEQQFDAAIMKKIARLHKLVTIPSLRNRGVVMSFGYAVAEEDNPLEILLSDPSKRYARETATFEFFATLREGLKHAATFRDDMSDDEFIATFLPPFAEIGDRYCTAVETLARVSPKPAQLAYGALVGVGQVYDSIMAYVNVSVKVGKDGSVSVQASAAVAVDRNAERRKEIETELAAKRRILDAQQKQLYALELQAAKGHFDPYNIITIEELDGPKHWQTKERTSDGSIQVLEKEIASLERQLAALG